MNFIDRILLFEVRLLILEARFFEWIGESTTALPLRELAARLTLAATATPAVPPPAAWTPDYAWFGKVPELRLVQRSNRGPQDLVHAALVPFQALCGADEPNQRTAGLELGRFGSAGDVRLALHRFRAWVTCPSCLLRLTERERAAEPDTTQPNRPG